jgi:hypothetical protein
MNVLKYSILCATGLAFVLPETATTPKRIISSKRTDFVKKFT